MGRSSLLPLFGTVSGGRKLQVVLPGAVVGGVSVDWKIAK